MTKTDLRFLEALKASLKNEQVTWAEPMGAQEWSDLFQTAELHRVLPLVYEAVYACPAARAADRALMAAARRTVIQSVLIQTRKTGEFLELYAHLRSQGLRPLVVKGIVCRQLYPMGDHRISADEDLLIEPSRFLTCQKALAAFGMAPMDQERDAYEIPFRKEGSPLLIELHQSLFPRDNGAYGDLNRFFGSVFSRALPMTIQGREVWTMGPTDHLFYLICHSFKHFLHSGFGLRQVCDILRFANAFGREVDWQELYKNCKAIRGEKFAAALFRLGQAHLGFDPKEACWPEYWQAVDVLYQPLLEDLLEAGIYGNGSMSRRHSSTITLSAVAAQKQGKAGNGIARSLFPSARELQGRFPYLKQMPWLLPMAWSSRILQYGLETSRTPGSDAAGAIKIGNQRLALLKAYGILEDSSITPERKRYRP